MQTVRTPSFADLLKQYRLASGHTQETLAAAARLSVRCISDLERGIKRAPRHDTVELLAEALRLSESERATFAASARAHTPRAGDIQTRLPAVHMDNALPPLVSREEDLAAIERFLQSGPPALFVTGEPGIGKTRLLQEAASRASAAGWRVLRGGTQRLGRLVPYAPLVGALCRYLTQRTPAQRREDLRGCGWLVRLLPELTDVPGAPAPDWTMPPEQERRLMFDAIARALDNIAGPAGTLLVLDDLHWAGSDALDLLVTLAHDAPDSSLRLLCAYRDTEVRAGDPLVAALADLAHAGAARQVCLGPLAPPDAASLLGQLLAEEQVTALAGQVLAQSGGVPFFLVSWAQAIQALGPEIDMCGAVPWNVAQSVSQRVAALPPIARELLVAAAAAGWRVSRALLLALAARSGHGEAAVIDALDATVQARMLVEVGADSYQFAHDLIRNVVLGALSAARRSVLYRDIAEAIETIETHGDEARATVRAHHVAQAGEEDKALLYLLS